jgi:TldD protein
LVDNELLKKALAVAVEKGADFADIYAEKAAFNYVIADDKRLRTAFTFENGIGLRVVVDGRTYYAITNSFEEPEILKVAAYVRDAAGSNGKTNGVIDLREKQSSWKYPFVNSPTNPDIDQRVDLVKRAEERGWQTPHAIQTTVNYRDHQRDIQIASTLNNNVINQSLGLTEFSVNVIVEKNGVRESGLQGNAFYGGVELLSGDYTPEKIAEKASDVATISLTAKDCPRGEMPVVFSPGANGILFHESCGHGMEADLVEKGSSFTGLLGKEAASPLVTLVDDGTLPGYPGSYEFDDEGNPSKKTVLIEKGILKNYMHSTITARKADVEPTGSGRRESFQYPPLPRMRNTYILGGDSNPEDIIKGTKRGLYAVKPGGGGQVNVFTGEFITSIKLGYMIEDGKITYPVKGASIVGRGIDALHDIDMVGNDPQISYLGGRCGKGQDVPVGVGMPTVRVKSLTVGGTGDAYEGGDQ